MPPVSAAAFTAQLGVDGGGAAEIAWLDGNQRYLSAALEQLQAGIERRLAAADAADAAEANVARAEKDVEVALRAMRVPPALERLCAAFDLSSFERDLLLLCVAAELRPASSGALGPESRPHVEGGPTGLGVDPQRALEIFDRQIDLVSEAATFNTGGTLAPVTPVPPVALPVQPDRKKELPALP